MMAVDLREAGCCKEDFVTWLQSEGVSAATIHVLEGQKCIAIALCLSLF